MQCLSTLCKRLRNRGELGHTRRACSENERKHRVVTGEVSDEEEKGRSAETKMRVGEQVVLESLSQLRTSASVSLGRDAITKGERDRGPSCSERLGPAESE